MPTDQYPRVQQTKAIIAASADLATQTGQPLPNTALPPQAPPDPLALYMRISQTSDPKPFKQVCQQSLYLSFFFDGTGNNLDADRGTLELSNAAKLFLAHQRSNKAEGRYSFYIPGIGTYFQEINDPGGTTPGLAFGAFGKERIDWALKQFNDVIKAAEALAENPRNKIIMIRVAAFGFSRGATLARAFAREIQTLCRQVGSDWQLQTGGYPIRFYFLGLWDTVASVGSPMSTNNVVYAGTMARARNISVMQARNDTANSARILAFGLPGADPAPGPSDGHNGWAHPLDIPTMIEKCVHMIAAHEIRNSFPLDSC